MSNDNLETSPREIAFAEETGSRPKRGLGKADDTEEETSKCTRWDLGIEGQASGERIAEITSGGFRERRRLVAACKDSSNEAINQRRGELDGIGE
jgi:hypothetical protein